MRSVADDLRAETHARLQALSPTERMDLALALGDEDLKLFCQARGVTRAEGMRLIQRQRQQGRTYSRCMDELLG